MTTKSIFDDIPSGLPQELFTTLLFSRVLRVERIVSRGHASPPGFWYDQEESEWVVVLKGRAVVQFEGEPEPVELQLGSYLSIPAHARHRVVSTSSSEETIWLAIHYNE